MTEAVLAGEVADDLDLGRTLWWTTVTWWAGVTLLWIAAGLTLVTGWDYFRKSLPYLRDEA
jgi:CDP-diacylglycerol--glycerol-3-phosphate 3-phosphatidyltransferase